MIRKKYSKSDRKHWVFKDYQYFDLKPEESINNFKSRDLKVFQIKKCAYYIFFKKNKNDKKF